MKTVENKELADMLLARQGEYVSGEEIAAAYGISRAAVGKRIDKLRESGIPVAGRRSSGYMIPGWADVLSGSRISGMTGGKYDVRVFSVLESTNTALRRAAKDGAAEGLVYIADRQTHGRGRMGRSFSSPAGTGLYMSVLLRPHISAESALLITTAAAAAMAEAIEDVSGRRSGIKWVNDILIGGRKVCGILTEAAFSVETGSIDYAVLGLGVNIREPEGGFPEELRSIAGAVCEKPVKDMRNRIAAGFLTRFGEYYSDLEGRRFYSPYLSRLVLIGKKINVIKPSGTETAKAVGLDRDFRLEVEYPDGRTELLSGGEVSTRQTE